VGGGGGIARKCRSVTKVWWWWFTFEPTCLEQTMHTFLNMMVLINHSQACDSFAAVHVQKLVAAACSTLLITVNVLVIFWCWQPLPQPHDLVCIGCGQVQYSALSLNDALKPLLSISWLWAFLPKMLLHTIAPPSHLCTSFSSMRRNK
jgi:hypothetical protein